MIGAGAYLIQQFHWSSTCSSPFFLEFPGVRMARHIEHHVTWNRVLGCTAARKLDSALIVIMRAGVSANA